MSVRSEWVDLKVDDGTTMRAWTARLAGPAPKRGMLVFQEAFGVNAHIRDVTERLAANGFLASAPELYHRTGPGFESDYTDFAVVMPHFQALTEQGLDADVLAAYG
jgi:carboxymethylenebutenolidase